MLNKVQLIGRLGADPEIRRLESGVAVARLNLATSKSWKDKDGNKQESTQWHNLQCWRGLAELAEKYLKKGSRIFAEGEITHRDYENKDGVKMRACEIVIDNFIMLDAKQDGGTGAAERPQEPTISNAQAPYNAMQPAKEALLANDPMPDDDDLPF
jgi:single-strand DNA-binding protein